MNVSLSPIHAVVEALSKGELPKFEAEGTGWTSVDFATDLRKVLGWETSQSDAWFELFASKVHDFSHKTVVLKFLDSFQAMKIGIDSVSGHGKYFSLTLQDGTVKYGHLGPFFNPVVFITPLNLDPINPRNKS